MGRIVVGNLLIPLYIFYTLITGPTLSFGTKIDNKILKVGEELWKETLPLQIGSCLYQLQGLKPHTCFSLQLRRGNLNSTLHVNKRLLNTEKLIFKRKYRHKQPIAVLSFILVVTSFFKRKSALFCFLLELCFNIYNRAIVHIVTCLSSWLDHRATSFR
ncbi:hypothetical protein UlMin_042536 [Ulmus minor]